MNPSEHRPQPHQPPPDTLRDQHDSTPSTSQQPSCERPRGTLAVSNQRIGGRVFLVEHERTDRLDGNEIEEEGESASSPPERGLAELVLTLTRLYSERLTDELKFARNDLANLEQPIASFELYRGLQVTFQHRQLRDTLQTHPLFPGSFFFVSQRRLIRYDVRERQQHEVASIGPSRIRYFKISPSGRFLMFGSGNGCYIVEDWRRLEFEDCQRDIRCGIFPTQGDCPNYAVFPRQDETSLYVAAQSRELRMYRIENSVVPQRQRRRHVHDVKVFGSQLDGLTADFTGPCLSFNLNRKFVVGSYANCVCENNPTRGFPHYLATATDRKGFQLLTDECSLPVFSEGDNECDYVEFSGDGRYFACAGDCELRVFEVCDCDSLPFLEIFSRVAEGTLSICKFHPTRHEILCWVEYCRANRVSERIYSFCVANIAKRELVFRLYLPFRVAGFDFEPSLGECVYLGLEQSPYVLRLDFAQSFLLGTEMQDRLFKLQKRQVLCDVVVNCEME